MKPNLAQGLPIISIIMPCFNGEKYLGKAIQSFIDQDYPADKKELIIVGNKSTDASNDIIRSFVDTNSTITWIEIPDKGISHASNIGIEHANGDIIGKLGVDDFLYEGVFEKLASAYRWSTADVFYFDAYVFDKLTNNYRLHICPNKLCNTSLLLRDGAFFSGESTFFAKPVFDRYQFNEGNKYCMDYELCLELSMDRNIKFLYVNEIAVVHIHDDNISTRFVENQFEEAAIVAKQIADRAKYKGLIYFSKKEEVTEMKIEQSLLKKIYHVFFKKRNY